MKRIAIAAVILAAIAAVAWALWPKPINVQVEAARPRDITLTVEAEGQSRIREVFTISAPAAGQVQLSPQAAARLLREVRTPEKSAEPLTERETDVLRLLAQGRPGDRLMCTLVSVEEAQALLLAKEHALSRLQEGLSEKFP